MSNSEILAVLEEAWAALQKANPGLPDTNITFGTHGSATIPGVFDAYVPAEYEQWGGPVMLGALGHEAAHILAEVSGGHDTSRQGRYHNQVFTDLVHRLGFYQGPIGVIVANHVEQPHLLSALNRLPAMLHRGGSLLQVPSLRCRPQRIALARKIQRATCLCEPSRSFVVSQVALARGEIICSICHAPFEHRNVDD